MFCPTNTLCVCCYAQWCPTQWLSLPSPGYLPDPGIEPTSPALLADFLPLHHLFCLGFPGDSDGIECACNAGEAGLIPGLGRSPGERNGKTPSVLAWEKPQTEEPSRLQFMGSQRIREDLVTHTHTHTYTFCPNPMHNTESVYNTKSETLDTIRMLDDYDLLI